MANYSFRDPGDEVEDNATIISGNFTQMYPDTPIMVDKPLVITGGNFTNVRKDAAWNVTGGNWTQVSRCSHLHPELIEIGLTECGADCVHVIDKDYIYVDGVLIDTVRYYEDLGV